MRSTIQFDTKVWEGDFRVVLQPHRMRAMIERNKHDFSRRLVMINNVDAMSGAVRRCKALVRSGIIDDFVVVDEHAQAVLDHFELDRNDFGIGYRYSIAELTALYLADSDLILHFAGDSMLDRDHDWVPASIDLLARRPEVAVVNLVWDGRLEWVRAESSYEDATFCYSQGFSDQMYMVRRSEFADRIYGHSHPDSERYPSYGGELFEKRVDSWMRGANRLRAVSKAGSYYHRNIRPRNSLLERLREATKHRP